MTAASERASLEVPALILVVDDTPASRYISSSWLRRQGHQVIEAGTGTEALAAVDRWPVDLVVLDVNLPDISGYEVCERLKAGSHSALPVIHLSATATTGSDRARGLIRGADAYLTEPVEPDELLATVSSVLRYYRARAAAETLADRLARLTAATMAMNSALTFNDLVAAVATGAAEVVGAPTHAVLSGPNAEPHQARAVPRASAEVVGVAGGSEVLAVVREAAARGGQVSLLSATATGFAASPPGPAAAALGALFGSVRGEQVAIVLGTGFLSQEDERLLTQLGQAAVLAVGTLRLYAEEHALALTLQRSFLSDLPPTAADLEIAARYVPAERNAEIGGDFYEFIELDHRRVLVAIGDVAGHSIHAATVMVELRHALRAYAVDGHGPAAVLNRLEHMFARFHPKEYATLCLLMLDRTTNQVAIANAGHLPPLLVQPSGSAYLEVYGPMLGLNLAHGPDQVVALPPVWSLVLITDGLVEAPRVPLDDALERLRAMCSLDESPAALCERILRSFAPTGRDDTAILILRRPVVADL